MDYNNGNNNNMNMQGPGMGQPPMGNPSMGQPPMSNPSMWNPNMQNPGMGRPPMGNQGMQNPNMRPPLMGNSGMQNQRIQNPGMFNPGMHGQMGQARSGGHPPIQSRADMESSRLAREIEKSVRGEARPSGAEARHGLSRAGGAGNTGFKLPEGIMESISGFSAYIFGAILVLCLIISLAAYGKDHKGGGITGRKVSIPADMITYTGIFRNAYEAATSGSLTGAGSNGDTLYNDDGTEVPPAPTAIGEEAPAATDPDDFDPSAVSSGDDAGTAEENGSETTGSGSSGSYGKAESYKELLDQLEKAIASGDSAYVASKMAYEDESGTLKAFPQTVVDHFVSYMSTNTDKLSSLMTDLGSDKYSGQNDGEFIVKLPYIKFVVNMGYDNTTVSIPGFNEQVVNAGQSADIAPLMPCMYTLTISNPDWNDVVTRDIEANINESTISINIKP